MNMTDDCRSNDNATKPSGIQASGLKLWRKWVGLWRKRIDLWRKRGGLWRGPFETDETISTVFERLIVAILSADGLVAV